MRIPDSHRLGDVNGGWTVALTTLMNERAAIGGGQISGSGQMGTERLIELVRHEGRDTDPLVRQQLAAIYIAGRVANYTNLRAMAKIAAGGLPGPEMSIAKLSLTANMRRTERPRVLGARTEARGRQRRMGNLRLVALRARRARDADSRRHRRGAPQHRLRAGARHAEGPEPGR